MLNDKDLNLLKDLLENARQNKIIKEILWEYISEKDLQEIERRIRDAK